MSWYIKSFTPKGQYIHTCIYIVNIHILYTHLLTPPHFIQQDHNQGPQRYGYRIVMTESHKYIGAGQSQSHMHSQAGIIMNYCTCIFNAIHVHVHIIIQT